MASVSRIHLYLTLPALNFCRHTFPLVTMLAWCILAFIVLDVESHSQNTLYNEDIHGQNRLHVKNSEDIYDQNSREDGTTVSQNRYSGRTRKQNKGNIIEDKILKKETEILDKENMLGNHNNARLKDLKDGKRTFPGSSLLSLFSSFPSLGLYLFSSFPSVGNQASDCIDITSNNLSQALPCPGC